MPVVYTVGHSTRSPEAFLEILRAFSIQTVADIRTVPRSRTNPQYNAEDFQRWLAAAGLEYLHLRDLGGLRKPRKDSVNAAWKNASFRGYADYMQTSRFESALNELVRLAADATVAMVCAEAVPWRCHRSLVADALLIRGIEVKDIMSATAAKPHVLTAWACVDGLRLTYPAVESSQ